MKVQPVVKSVWVPVSPERAFRRLTAEMGRWWPLASHSLGGALAESVVFGEGVGAGIVERTSTGVEHLWGTVTEWNPPTSVGFTWHPGRAPSQDMRVVIRFVALDGGTDVQLEHSGWESLGEGWEAQRTDYDSGWQGVLARFSDTFAGQK